MRNVEEPGPGDPRLLRHAMNLMPLDPFRPSPFIGRPGYDLVGDRDGGDGSRTGQLVAQLTKEDGSEFSVKIVGGKFYTLNWGTGVWTEALEATDFANAGITLSTSARCYAVQFVDQLVVSDGTNTPWMWDGTAGGGLTKLTNAPVAFGQPVVYAAKLFFIKATERNVIVWSEENQPNTGYEADGYNNAWGLTQTETGALNGLVASNEALDVFRGNSNTSIFGAVTPQFQTAHTEETGSETIGTISPAALVKHDRVIWFLDREFRPHIRVPGSGVVEMWDDCIGTRPLIAAGQAASALGIYDPSTEMVLFAVPAVGSTVPNLILAFNPKPERPRFVGIWTGMTVQAWGIVTDAAGAERLMHLDDQGYAYVHGTRSGQIWNDNPEGEPAPIRHEIESATLGYADDSEATFVRTDFIFAVNTEIAACEVTLQTARGQSAALGLSVAGTAGSLFNIAIFNVDVFSSSAPEVHRAVGFDRTSRWARWRVVHEALGERFGLGRAKTHAVRDSHHPAVA